MTLDEAKMISCPVITRTLNVLSKHDAEAYCEWVCELVNLAHENEPPCGESPIVPDAVIQYPPLELGGES